MSEPRTCRACKHCGIVEQGTKLACRWELSFLPPPVFRERLWGKDAPITMDGNAEDCPQFEASEGMA